MSAADCPGVHSPSQSALLPTDDRYPATSLEDCQRLCELGTVGCREDCNGVLPTASTPNLSPCDSIAYGPTCVTYTDNVLTDSTQTWGFDYWTVEAGGTPLYVQAPEPLGWVEANAWCQQHHFALASVHCQAQQDLLTSVCTDNCWIGLNDVDSEGDFRWSDDSPCKIGSPRFDRCCSPPTEEHQLQWTTTTSILGSPTTTRAMLTRTSSGCAKTSAGSGTTLLRRGTSCARHAAPGARAAREARAAVGSPVFFVLC